MEKPRQTNAIHRKPLPRLPAQPQQPDEPPPSYVAQEDVTTTTQQPLAALRPGNGMPGNAGHGVGVAPQRQGTASTTMTTATASSNAPTLAMSARTSSTAVTTPTPSLPSRPPTLAGPSPAGGATTATQKEPSIWKTALDETRFFAGGLLPRPFVSTKHYTVLRHSAGLVMYRGPTTNVVVTLFSTPDHPVPADRTVWLQRRGFSGDTGLRLKTLVGASGSWLDVTPDRRAAATELPAADERGYQRDMAKLMKKTAGKHMDKALARRVPRETLVVRIPAACADGYFRLVVCACGRPGASGSTTRRKTLCGSPVFRVASTSTDVSIFRGASLRTLPLEAGAKIVSMLGNAYVTNAAAPIVTTVQDQVAKYQPGTLQTMAAETAYGNSGLAGKVDAAGESYERHRDGAYSAYHGGGLDGDDDDDAPPEVVGPDAGPDKPFPLSFQGRVVPATGRSAAELGMPTANLAGLPDDLRMRLRGVYCGWAIVVPGKKGPQPEDPRVPHDWTEALVTVGPSQWAGTGSGSGSGSGPASVLARHEVAVHLLYDLGGAPLTDAKLKVMLMGFLRPAGANGPGGAHPDDALVAVTSLSRPAWGPQATLARIETEKSARTLSDKYVDTRGRIQRQVDRVPVHWVGVRTAGGEMRDQMYGNGGLWIQR